jgi:hypothetical protein
METPLCMVDGCGSPVGKTRGLCQGCYKSALRLVDRGKTTWGELIHLGLAKGEPDRPSSPLRRALKAARTIPITLAGMAPSERSLVRPDNSSARVWSALVHSLQGAA